jgi:outer membrane protein OmpA-like peptidoglycan-associated protein
MSAPHSNIYATRPVIVTVAAGAAIILLLLTAAAAVFAWNTHSPKLLYALAAIWAVGPPAWFWFEYFYLYRSLGNPEAFEQFKYGQQVAVAIWAGVALALFAYLSSERFKPAPGNVERSEAALPGAKPLLLTPHFAIFGAGPNIDFRELGAEIVAASATAGAKSVRELIQGIGDGIDVAKKGVDLTAALVDLYRKIWPEKAATVSQPPPPPPPVVPTGTLFDQKVTFRLNSAELDPKTRDRLSSVAQTLSAGRIAVLIEGHADGVGTASFNERLSQRRAEAVRQFLSDRGVLADQMHTYGYGKGYLWFPYAPQDDANRRVRIIECEVAAENRCQVSAAVPARKAASN